MKLKSMRTTPNRISKKFILSNLILKPTSTFIKAKIENVIKTMDTRTGARTGEIHGTGIRNNKSSVSKESGQLIKTFNQR